MKQVSNRVSGDIRNNLRDELELVVGDVAWVKVGEFIGSVWVLAHNVKEEFRILR